MINKRCIHAAIIGCITAVSTMSCGDALNQLGSSILPDEDRVTVYADTFQVVASTVKIDSLFAKTGIGYLGEFYDPLYGRLKSDYICQFYCEEDFQFEQTPQDGKIDAVSLHLVYDQWVGDPNVPMQATVYPVVSQLYGTYYGNIDPADFCDINNPVLSQAYSVKGGALDTTLGYDIWTQTLDLPIEWGQRLYDETINNPSTFKSQKAFNEFFPGFYITTNYGSGSIIYVYQTQIAIDYHYTLQSTTGEDSVIYLQEVFNVSKDVIQMNNFQNTDTEQLLEDNDDYTYLKTPAGIFTRLVVPTTDIKHVIENHIVNYVDFSLKYMPEEDWLYALTPPPYLLLLPEDSLISFFESRSTDNSITSFLSTYTTSSASYGYNASTRTYPMPNLANLINYHIAYNPDEDLRLLAIPVSRSTVSDSYYTYTAALSHYLAPSGLKIRKDGNNMNISIISSRP